MKKKKIILLSILTLVLLLGWMTFSAFVIVPSEKYYELTVSDIPEEVQLGQEIEVTAKLKNKSVFTSSVIRGFNFIYIFFYPEGSELADQIAIPAVAITDVILPFEAKKQTESFTPTQAGDYVVEIYASFLIGEKNYKSYEFFEILNFSVV